MSFFEFHFFPCCLLLLLFKKTCRHLLFSRLSSFNREMDVPDPSYGDGPSVEGGSQKPRRPRPKECSPCWVSSRYHPFRNSFSLETPYWKFPPLDQLYIHFA